MSGDQLACSSFGDQTAQPSTPTRTPNSNTSSSPLLHTPKDDRNYAEDTAGWTPGFAKEYSVFINTPGYSREAEGLSEELGSKKPAFILSGQKASLSRDRLPAGLTAASANPSSSPDSAQLSPSVESLVGLSLPREPLVLSSFNSLAFSNQLPHPTQTRSVQKISPDTADPHPAQIITPPPSRHKGQRKLAGRLDASVMHNDQDFVQQEYLETSHQLDMGSYMTNQGDMFNFQLSGTTTGDFANPQPFWETDPSLEVMDIDFNGASSSLFRQEPHPPSRPMNSLNWETSAPNHFIPENVLVNGGRVVSSGGNEHVMVSQAPMQALMTSSADQIMYTGTYATAIDNSFGIINTGVDPGLLFSRPSSATMDASFDAVAQGSSRGPSRQISQGAQSGNQGASVAKVPLRGELRRSASEREMEPRKKDKVRATSPVKPIGRPGLGRSLSENRGKRPGSRAILPVLAPAPRSQSQLSNSSGLGISRPILSQPETAGPRTRTQAKFTIDENGRARVETTLVVERDNPMTVRKRTSSQSVGGCRRWCSEDDEESSADDEPIIIPSRNTSFSIPDPRKSRTAVNSSSHSQPNFSFSAQSTTSLGSFRSDGGLHDLGDESDEEILFSEMTPTSKMSGNAVNELLKLREDRMRQKPSPSIMRRLTSSSHSNSTGTSVSMNFASRFTASPTALTEASLPTPSSSNATASVTKMRAVRCICKRPDLDPGNAFMVQCESCEMWLHGRCVKITSQRAMPSIYICAYCANLKTTTFPIQGSGGGNGVYSSSSRTVRQSAVVGKGTPGVGTTIRPTSGSSLGSPLAHKSSFKSFR
ncbi:uncharacterized protein B0T23DRAFT_111481 [Neurospora hispaniola]|uniref:Zinc finger PHD-type domain-containing protein n=1 Tax=Neurospora hispaniola TaxID=588809 RepID=A0AAJ0I9P4_9PEZI|nr:hypothetical protein B0T23DRAFT_111481 [Neurospora hispaniola]